MKTINGVSERQDRDREEVGARRKMKGERAIAKYVEAYRAYEAVKVNAPIASDIPNYESSLKLAKERVKAAHAVLNGSQIGEARRRLWVGTETLDNRQDRVAP